MNRALGLREQKKLATKAALHEAAIRLAVRDGYDAVTVEAIADAAGVSRRTFSNYFSSKEEAVLYGDSTRLQSLLDAVAARPAEDSAWTALRAATNSVLRELQRRRRECRDEDEPDWLTRARLIRSHPVLLSRQAAAYASFERALADELVHRLPQESGNSVMRARVIAACFLAALRVGTQTWLDHSTDASLSEIIDEVLAEAGRRFE